MHLGLVDVGLDGVNHETLHADHLCLLFIHLRDVIDRLLDLLVLVYGYLLHYFLLSLLYEQGSV